MTQVRRTAILFLVSVLASVASFDGAQDNPSASRGTSFDAAQGVPSASRETLTPAAPFDIAQGVPSVSRGAQTRSLPSRLTDEAFWKAFQELSEDGGSFPSNNFVSNETEFQT